MASVPTNEVTIYLRREHLSPQTTSYRPAHGTANLSFCCANSLLGTNSVCPPLQFSDQAGSDVFTPSTDYYNSLLQYVRSDGTYRLTCSLPNKDNTWSLEVTVGLGFFLSLGFRVWDQFLLRV